MDHFLPMSRKRVLADLPDKTAIRMTGTGCSWLPFIDIRSACEMTKCGVGRKLLNIGEIPDQIDPGPGQQVSLMP